MGLFSTLSNTEETNKSLQIPTIVQLYSTATPIKLDPSVKTPGYAALSYQAVASTKVAEEGLRQSTTQITPDLGIWSCRVKSQKGSPLADALLQRLPQAKTFCFYVDLSDLENVETSISLQQETLIRYLIAQDHTESDKMPTQTTTLYALRSAQFGLAPDDDTFTKAAPDEQDRQICVALYITAKLPEKPIPEEDIRQKQALALVTYHLRRLAAQLNACLSFVGDEEEQLSETQLPLYWREFASGTELWKDEEYKHVYGPDSHNTDLIESVLLRNATYPGHWDASKESIWKILRPEGEEATEAKDEKTPVGDEHWLSELRESMGSAESLKTPPPKKKEQQAEKTPNDAATAAFFESLLK